MNSINPHYTLHYSQPESYHFSHDSNFLAREVSEIILKESLNCETVLDLCSGCGVLGMDLLIHLNNKNSVKIIDFLEIQEIYRVHFLKNIQSLKQRLSGLPKMNFLQKNYNQLSNDSSQYDLIICNPPYFRPGHGILSGSDFKNRCRFFIDSDFKSLITGISYSLKLGGVAFILIKSLTEHGINIESESTKLQMAVPLRGIRIK